MAYLMEAAAGQSGERRPKVQSSVQGNKEGAASAGCSEGRAKPTARRPHGDAGNLARAAIAF